MGVQSGAKGMDHSGAGAYAGEERNDSRRQQRYSVRAAQLLPIGLFLVSSKKLRR
jgi:hypothetical protein